MTKEKALKLQAKKHLQGNWPAAVGATITVLLALMTAIYLAGTLFTIIINLLTSVNPAALGRFALLPLGLQLVLIIVGVILTSPLMMGYVRFCYLLSKNSVCDYSQVFYYITKERYTRTLIACTVLLIKNIWQIGLAFMPAVLCFLRGTANTMLKDNLAFSDILWYYLSYALLFAGILFFYVLTKEHFLAIYFYVENDNLNAQELCDLSRRATYRFQKNITKLIISLLPMMLLCILIIPCLFVLPYVMVTQATSAKWMIALSYKDEG